MMIIMIKRIYTAPHFPHDDKQDLHSTPFSTLGESAEHWRVSLAKHTHMHTDKDNRDKEHHEDVVWKLTDN